MSSGIIQAWGDPIKSAPVAKRHLAADVLVQVVIVIAALCLLVHWSGEWGPGHDEYWHIYFGEVEPFSFFVSEILRDTHPPPHYLLLRMLTSPGADPLWARLASMIPALVSIPLLFLVGRGLGLSRALSHLGALTLAVCPAWVGLGVCIRSYAFGHMLALAALLGYVGILSHPHSKRRWYLFFGATALAPWFLYTSAFSVLPLAGALVLMTALPGPRRRLIEGWRVARPLPGLLFMVGSLLAVPVYYKSTRPAGLGSYLGEFLPQRTDSIWSYGVRGLNGSLSLFTPLSPDGDNAWSALTFVLFLLVLMLAFLSRRNYARASIPFLLLAILVQLWLAGWLERHPFGGKMRHQSLMLTVLLLCALVALEPVLRAVRRERVRIAIVSLAAVLTVVVSLRAFTPAPGPDEFGSMGQWTYDYARLVARFEDGDTIFLPDYDYIRFYGMSREEGPWKLIGSVPRPGGPPRARLSGRAGGHPVILTRRRGIFTVPSDPGARFMGEMAEIMETESLRRLWIVAHRGHGKRSSRPPGFKERLSASARRLGLELAECVPFSLDTGEAYLFRRP